MAFSPKTGHKMKLYRNTGTVASPTWSEVDEIGDVSIPSFNVGTAELKRRGSNFTKALATLIQLVTVEFRLIYGLDSTNYDAIRQAAWNMTVSEWAIMDGAIETTGSQGIRLPALVTDFPWDQPLEDVAGHDVTLSLAYMEESSTEVDPQWYTVAGGGS